MTTALIAEDEVLLAQALQDELYQLWPELTIVATATHGHEAVEQALALRPQVCFLDVRMPGMNGLEAAQAIMEDWPAGTTLPLLVFVTAYDEYALRAFDAAAIDYLLKPVGPQRLCQTCERLRERLRQQHLPQALDTLADTLNQLQSAQHARPTPAASDLPLRVIRAQQGDTLHMVPVDRIDYFEAADKYVRVLAADGEWLIRTPLRELMPQLDPALFWQVHRSVVVRAAAIRQARRDDSGRLHLQLHGHEARLPVSRLYAHRFKAM